jgi:O-acetyl-ADP-ribose deacetylase (regulator of RNase III)
MAKITNGYNLPVKYVIHAVGPVYRGSDEDRRLLSQCYVNSLKLAVENHIKSIAFPAISCGAYGYPLKEACSIAIDTTCDFLKNNRTLKKVVFILFSTQNYDVYKKYLKNLGQNH